MNTIQQLFKQIFDLNLWEETKVLNRNEFLTQARTTDTNLYFVVSGSLKIYLLNNCEEHIVRFSYQNNFFGSLDSFISEKPSEFFTQAIKKTELKVISKSSFMKFIHQSENNLLLWDKILQQIILQQLEREKDLLVTSPKERYHRVLERSPQLFQEIPNKHIASYLRMSPETLSRLKKS